MRRLSVRRDDGVALLVVLVATALLAALTAALVLAAAVETRIPAALRDGTVASYAAESGMAAVLADLRTSDPDVVLAGAISGFTDGGGPGGVRTLDDGTRVDLDRETALLLCGRPACTAATITSTSPERPWGAANPRWRVYGYGRLVDLLPGPPALPGAPPAPADPGDAPDVYVIVWVADDPTDADGNQLADAPPGTPGHGLLFLAARAYGRGGLRRTVRVVVERTDTGLRIVARREAEPPG